MTLPALRLPSHPDGLKYHSPRPGCSLRKFVEKPLRLDVDGFNTVGVVVTTVAAAF